MKNLFSILVIATLAVASSVAAQQSPEVIPDSVAPVQDSIQDSSMPEGEEGALWNQKKHKHHKHHKHGKHGKHGKKDKKKECCVKYVTIHMQKECAAKTDETVEPEVTTSAAPEPTP